MRERRWALARRREAACSHEVVEGRLDGRGLGMFSGLVYARAEWRGRELGQEEGHIIVKWVRLSGVE